MKKYLMRGGVSPLDNFPPELVIARNSIGANSGNLLYAYGVYRTLLTEDTIIDVDYYGVERCYTDKDIDRINEEYDAYICPLADAFRDAFTEKLVKYANFFKKLKIPCYVIGVGLRAPYEPNVTDSHIFDDAAKQFVSAALDKSAIVGLRGEITGCYLKHLGFREGIDYTPIGCPSMYAKGKALDQRQINLSDESRIAFNLSSITPENIMQFAFCQMQSYKNHYLVEQNQDELKLLFYGSKYKPNKNASELLPRDVFNPLMQKDRYRIFINIPTWLNFLRTIDLSIGSKLHGNVAAVLSGCPAIFFPLDSRMRELVAYHAFPAITHDAVKPTDTIREIVEKIDLRSHIVQQGQNFQHFLYFLNKNQIDHIYKEDSDRQEAPLDELIAQRTYCQVESALYCKNDELIRRFEIKSQEQLKTISNLKKRVATQDAFIKQPVVQYAIEVINTHPHLKRWIEKRAGAKKE